MKGSLCQPAETSFLWRDTAMRIRERFNPRAPCGARQHCSGYTLLSCPFQPTRPVRGATRLLCRAVPRLPNFNPRAPCGARLRCGDSLGYVLSISTHAPLAGRDASCRNNPTSPPYFNPRAPCGARQQKCTNHYAHFCDNRQISDAFAQNAACQGILLLFDAGKPCGFWVRTAQVISAHLCFAL